ncbi:uncharacterized protein LTR77_003217 [Saxophila tyrrhenica]|uniref:D-serine dehydratase-like domain-containing protein n=1 Tax=Saxophila tyrrhenica TaxID=1690608 RepID=A0AAV9PHM5_9PEZI|nr:hypothetical protein LTR77_003217 [Saxophila tyrrhenica]
MQTPSSNAPSAYPSPSVAALQLQYVGNNVKDVQTPAAVIDAAVVRRNSADEVDVGFRAHVKTHKVACLFAMLEYLLKQVADDTNRQAPGRRGGFEAGKALLPSAVPRLAAVARILGEGTVGLFTDHPAHIKLLDEVDDAAWPGTIPVWVNIDVGDHREGVPPESGQLADVAYAVAASKRVRLAGVYTHLGTSYGSSSPDEALQYMARELEGLEKGAISFLKCTGATPTQDGQIPKVTLSLGATPTATAVQNIVDGTEGAQKYREMLDRIKQSFDLEIHAGVYPVMDMQQMAARARPTQSAVNPAQSLLSYSDLGFRLLVEVASTYSERTDKPEALVAAGSIALGREPCKSYPGWGVVTPWPEKSGSHYDPEGSKTGWIVGSISQEHGVLAWEGAKDSVRPLELGQKLMLWPNHACIAGANHGWYVVVDSDKADPNVVQDVWLRWRGW